MFAFVNTPLLETRHSRSFEKIREHNKPRRLPFTTPLFHKSRSNATSRTQLCASPIPLILGSHYACSLLNIAHHIILTHTQPERILAKRSARCPTRLDTLPIASAMLQNPNAVSPVHLAHFVDLIQGAM